MARIQYCLCAVVKGFCCIAEPSKHYYFVIMTAYRMNGAGNAFVVVDRRGTGRSLAPSVNDVVALNDIAPFDQLIGLEDDPDGADARLRVWNCDGPEVGACGNGTRAAAWLMFQNVQQDELALSSLGGAMSAKRLSDGAVEVDLGLARLDWSQIPLVCAMDTAKMEFEVDLPGGGKLVEPGAVNMGNPHCVFFLDDLDAVPIEEIGPRVELDPHFPEQVNVGFAQVRGCDSIRLRVWERGAGLTQACGTGAAAALVAACRQGLTDRQAIIEADGGSLPVRWDGKGHVHLSGPVEMEGTLTLEGQLSQVFG
jgi:diaminopimelate epimerase